MKNLTGRPNQGKTETIGERTVDVYLPSKEMVAEWKEAAKTAEMSLSRYVVEVVERHREEKPEGMMPNWELEEKATQLEKEFIVLKEKYDTISIAFAKQEQELKRTSEALQKASKSSVDPDITRRLIRIIYAEPDEIFFSDIMAKLGIADADTESIGKLRDASALLTEIGLIENGSFLSRRWKFGRPAKRPHVSVHIARRPKRRRDIKA
jgi:hypothetical protein